MLVRIAIGAMLILAATLVPALGYAQAPTAEGFYAPPPVQIPANIKQRPINPPPGGVLIGVDFFGRHRHQAHRVE